MADFIAKYWIEVVFGLITTSLGFICKHFYNELKKYRNLLTKEQEAKLDEHIDVKLEPVLEEIELIRAHLRETQEEDARKFDLIIASYRFRLIQLCKIYIAQGYMNQNQYDQLVEFFKMYEGFGGNGQAKQYYEKTIMLPIKND